MLAESSFKHIAHFQSILAMSAMKLMHAGQVMIGQEIDKIQKLAQELEDANENEFLPLLHEAAKLFEIHYNSKEAHTQAVAKIDQFLNEHAQFIQDFSELKDSLLNFKIYLHFVDLLNSVMVDKQRTRSEVIAELEKNLKSLLKIAANDIKRSPLLNGCFKNLLQCLQKLKLINIKSRLENEVPQSTRDQSRFERWRAGLQAFKIFSSSPHLMSNAWLKNVIDRHIQGRTRFFNKDMTVSKAGLTRFEVIIKHAFDSNREMINQDDLALLGVMFGRKATKKVLVRYGLKCDGSTHYPFTVNNLKALLLGLAANINTNEMNQVHPKAKAIIAQIKTSFKTASELAQNETLNALKIEFEHEKQNRLALSLKNVLKKTLYNGFQKLISKFVRYIQNWFITSVNFIDSEWVKEHGVKLFDGMKPVNFPLTYLTEDLALLHATSKIDNYIFDVPGNEKAHKKVKALLIDLQNNNVRKFCLLHKTLKFSENEQAILKAYHDGFVKKDHPEALVHLEEQIKIILLSKLNPWDSYVDEVIADLKNLDFKRFIKKYPAFNESNGTSAEYSKLKHFAYNNATSIDIRSVILQKLQALYPFARATLFSHILAYNSAFYTAAKKEVDFNLPLEDGTSAHFALKPVIEDEEGLAISLFSPQEAKGDTIPLLIMIEGTHDMLSWLRDLHPLGAGMHEMSAHGAYLQKMLSAINHEVEALSQKYPDKKISIELFGHSLAGADVYGLSLALQEAMAQNKYKTDQGEKDYRALNDPHHRKGFKQANNPELRANLVQGLDEGLGLVDRDFGQNYHENRKFDETHISALNTDHIANIKLYAKNSAGCHHKLLSALAATASFLGMNSTFKLFDNPLDLAGDAVQRTAHARGLYMADPKERFFKNVIHLNHCKFKTGKDGLFNQAMLLAEQRLAPLEVHQEKIFDRGPLSWLQKDVRIVKNDSSKNMDYLKNELFNPVTLQGNRVVDIWAYRKLKSIVYMTVYLTTAILFPIYALTSAWLSQFEKMLANVFGIVSSKPEKVKDEGLPVVKRDLLARQECLLFSQVRTQSSGKLESPATVPGLPRRPTTPSFSQ